MFASRSRGGVGRARRRRNHGRSHHVPRSHGQWLFSSSVSSFLFFFFVPVLHVILPFRSTLVVNAYNAALANQAGIRVFVTGGIGGVHRGVEETMDIRFGSVSVDVSGFDVCLSLLHRVAAPLVM